MPFKHPAYLILFLVLITPLGIAAQSLGLGTDGLFLCVLAALGGTLAVPFLLRLIRAHLAASLDGKPSLLEFLLGPPGYHHPLMLEGPDDEVIGTDLVVDAHDEENALSPTPTPAAASKIALIARNPRNALYLAPTFCPDVDDLVGEGIVGFGSKGSGKTNLGALLTEQFGRFYLPMAIFDIEGDYLSLVDTPPPVLPHGMIAGHPEAYAQFPDERFLAVDAENAALIGYTILEEGMQTVFALRTWANDDERARIMIQVIKGLTAWADEQPPESRVPCLLFLDEAARWLPREFSGRHAVHHHLLRAALAPYVSCPARHHRLEALWGGRHDTGLTTVPAGSFPKNACCCPTATRDDRGTASSHSHGGAAIHSSTPPGAPGAGARGLEQGAQQRAQTRTCPGSYAPPGQRPD
jgi:hypothetical protein